MRKVSTFSIIIIAGILISFLYSCKDKDKFAPKIYINGNETVYTELEKHYNDPGAIAEDNLDGSITSSITYGHNIPMKLLMGDSVTKRTGAYLYHYFITDKAGNAATAERNVIVRNWAWPYEAEFMLYRKKVSGSATDSCGFQYGSYPLQTPRKYKIASHKEENRHIVLPIGGEINLKVDAVFDSSTLYAINPKIIISQQDVIGVIARDTTKVKYRVMGYGSNKDASFVSDTASGRKLLIIKYYIAKFPTLSSIVPGNNFVYTDTLKQRY